MPKSLKSNQDEPLRTRSLWISLLFVIIIQVTLNPLEIITKDDQSSKSIDITKPVTSLAACASSYFVNDNNNIFSSLKFSFLSTTESTGGKICRSKKYHECNQKVLSVDMGEQNENIYSSRGEILCMIFCVYF